MQPQNATEPLLTLDVHACMQVVFGAGVACGGGIVLATNLAYALTGNLAASYAAQVVIDGCVTLAQQRAVGMQPVQVSCMRACMHGCMRGSHAMLVQQGARLRSHSCG